MNFKTGFSNAFRVIGLLGLSCLAGWAQTTATCNAGGTVATSVASTGLAEKVGDVVITCSGGTSGLTAIGALYITLNTNITNTVDANGVPKNITFNATGAIVAASNVALASATTVQVTNVSYTVPSPNTTAVVMTISGIRAAVASIQNGLPPTQVLATLAAPGFSVQANQALVAIGTNSVQSSVLNNGIPCIGSPLPSTIDFPGFVTVQTSSSAVRVTEAVANAFAAKDPTTTNGTRVIVRYSGYGTGVRLFVPDALVGSSGTLPTSGGEFASSVQSGTYTPSSNQLLLSRVSGADQNGLGGTLVTAIPASATNFTSISELTVTGGSAYAVYEVLDSNPLITESFQAPVFIVNAANNCATSVQTDLSAMLAPISTVSIATATDTIPRYISAPLASDCQQDGDCSANYYPVLSIATTPISLSGSSLGAVQTASIPISNTGGSQLSLAISIAYQTGSGWLTATPTSGGGSLSLVLAANPAALQAGTYTATVNLNAGNAGSAAIPVTFTVGPVGVTIQALVNAFSYQAGAIAPGSYVALFGLDLLGTSGTGTNPVVTFNGLAANVIYSSGGQINLIVPASLSGQNSATVQVAVAGQGSNSFTVSLTPNMPGVFPTLVNSNGTLNAATSPTSRGSFVQIYLTGLALPVVSGTVTVNIGAQTNLAPLFAGAQPTLPALDQINVTVPAGLTFTGNSTPVQVCVTTLPGTQPICSNTVSLYVQ